MMARVVGSLGLVFGLAVVSCAGDPGRPKTFSTDWLDDQGKTISEVERRLRNAKAGPSTDLVVSVSSDGTKIIGTPLTDGAQWTVTHALDARPIIAGGVVVLSGDKEIAAFEASSGKRLWARPTGGMGLLGVGDDGNLTAVTFSRSGGSTLLIVGRDGSVKRQIETDKAIGDPAVVGGVVFVAGAYWYVHNRADRASNTP